MSLLFIEKLLGIIINNELTWSSHWYVDEEKEGLGHSWQDNRDTADTLTKTEQEEAETVCFRKPIL